MMAKYGKTVKETWTNYFMWWQEGKGWVHYSIDCLNHSKKWKFVNGSNYQWPTPPEFETEITAEEWAYALRESLAANMPSAVMAMLTSERHCQQCNNAMPPGKQAGAKFCSDKCKMRNSRAKQKEPAAPSPSKPVTIAPFAATIIDKGKTGGWLHLEYSLDGSACRVQLSVDQATGTSQTADGAVNLSQSFSCKPGELEARCRHALNIVFTRRLFASPRMMEMVKGVAKSLLAAHFNGPCPFPQVAVQIAQDASQPTVVVAWDWLQASYVLKPGSAWYRVRIDGGGESAVTIGGTMDFNIEGHCAPAELQNKLWQQFMLICEHRAVVSKPRFDREWHANALEHLRGMLLDHFSVTPAVTAESKKAVTPAAPKPAAARDYEQIVLDAFSLGWPEYKVSLLRNSEGYHGSTAEYEAAWRRAFTKLEKAGRIGCEKTGGDYKYFLTSVTPAVTHNAKSNGK